MSRSGYSDDCDGWELIIVSDPAVASGITQLGAMITDLSKSRDKAMGNSEGISTIWAILLALAGLGVGVWAHSAIGSMK